MSSAVGIIVIVVGILVSIALHEVGHMVPAKKFGVRVSEYFVGLGPTLWSRKRGETEYGIKAIPLGGYVRLIGMYPPAPPGTKPRRGRIAELVRDARAMSQDEILPGQEPRAFYNLSAPKKLTVMLGGPVMNLIIAIVLISIAQLGFGQLALSTVLAPVQQCMTGTAVADHASGACPDGQVASPAYTAGLIGGDEITAVNGTAVTSWEQLRDALGESGGESLTLTYVRDGGTRTVAVEPVELERGDAGASTRRAYVGVSPSYQWDRQSITTVPGMVWDQVSGTAEIIWQLPVKVYQSAQAAFGEKERGTDSVLSVVGVGRIAGEVTSAETYGAPPSVTWVTLIHLLASLNIALFVFNLIPLVPLDGGHVAGALYEGLKRTWARVRGRTRPRPADTARMVPVAYGMFIVLIAMAAVMIYADIVAPVSIFGG